MLTISSPLTGAKAGDYYLKLAQEGYYGLEGPGYWMGRGSELLQLRGTVSQQPLRRLMDGFSPDRATPLVQNAGQTERQKAWDLTFSAPKSVSVLWALAPEPVRQQIEQAHQESVATALKHMEEAAGRTRRGHGGMRGEPAALVFAVFQHSTSRALDPQLHSHALLLNAGLRGDGTSGALDTRPVFRAKMECGALYQETLAAELKRRLGCAIEPEKTAFHIAGVPKELCRQMSGRRQSIERELAQRGKSDAISAKLVALQTRPRKQYVPRDQLFVQWRREGTAFGWSTEQAEQLIRQAMAQAQDRVLRSGQRAPGASPAASQATAARVIPAAAADPHRERVAAAAWASSEQARQPQPERGATTFTSQQGAARLLDKPEQRQNHSGQGSASSTDNQQQSTHSGRGSDRGQSRPNPNRDRSQPSSQQAKRPWLVVEWRRLFDKTPWLPVRPQVLHMQWHSFFPNAPWRPAQKLKLPVLIVALPALGRRPEFHPRWGRIHRKQDVVLGEFRIQKKFLAPKAPKWSPLYKRSLPAFHWTARKSKSAATQPWKSERVVHSH